MARTRRNHLPRWAVAAGGLLATAGFWVAVTGSPSPVQETAGAAPMSTPPAAAARVQGDDDRLGIWRREDDE